MDDSLSRTAFNGALRELGIAKGFEKGMYAPLVKRFPMRVGDEVPAHIRGLLGKNHTCACTDSNIVYVDTDKANDMFTKAKEFVTEGEKRLVSERDARDNYKTLLVHEYTHIIMQHVDKGIKFVRANGDKNYPIFALACDIEANRGFGIIPESDLYQIGVTDKSYPECVGVDGLMNIYRVLKKNYGDEIRENYDRLRSCLDDEDEDEDEDEGKEAEAEEAENEKVSEQGEEAPKGSESSEASDGGEDSEATKRQKALEKAIRSMEQMLEEIEQKASLMTEDELDKGIEQFDEETGEGQLEIVDGKGSAIGSYDGSPREVIEKVYNADTQKKVEKAIEHLKGIVRGKQIRTRTKTYSRQSRKEGADGLIRKGVKNDKSLAPRILVAMDSSGSMYSTQVTPIATTIGTLAKMLGKTKGSYICEHDGMVKNVNPLSKWEVVVKGYYPDGDNDFDEVLKKAIELNVEVVIDVGDGYCEFYDRDVMKQAHDKGIKWVDVQVCGSEEVLRQRCINEDKSRFGDIYIGREIIKVGGGD